MNLKQIRNEKGLSVRKLSELADVPVRTIEDIERFDRCKVDTAIKLADALEVSYYSTLSTLPIHINLRQNKRRYWISYSDAFSDRLTVPVPSVLS